MTAVDDLYGSVTAKYYDRAYEAMLGVRPDIAFYRGLARESGGPILELGCGTGRVLLELVRDGFDCTGIDLSEPMLDALRDAADATPPHLIAAPMQRFELPGVQFALIFSAFRAFQHLVDVDDQLACLDCVRRHLRPGGTFAFDVFKPHLDRMLVRSEPATEDLRFHDGGDEIVRFVEVERDTDAQVLHVTMRYRRLRQGEQIDEEVTRFPMRWFTRFELEHLMARAGFDDVMIYGDFDRSSLQTDSPAFIVVARAHAP